MHTYTHLPMKLVRFLGFKEKERTTKKEKTQNNNKTTHKEFV